MKLRILLLLSCVTTLTSLNAQNSPPLQNCDSLHLLAHQGSVDLMMDGYQDSTIQRVSALIANALECDSSNLSTYFVKSNIDWHKGNEEAVLMNFVRIDEICGQSDMLAALQLAEQSFKLGYKERGQEAANRALKIVNTLCDTTDVQTIENCVWVLKDLKGKLAAERYLNGKIEFLDEERFLYLIDNLEMAQAWSYYHQQYGLTD